MGQRRSRQTMPSYHRRGYPNMTNIIKPGAIVAGLHEEMRMACDALGDASDRIRAAAGMAEEVAEFAQVMPCESATKRETVCNAVDRAAFELGELLGAAKGTAKWVRHACEALEAEGVA